MFAKKEERSPIDEAGYIKHGDLQALLNNKYDGKIAGNPDWAALAY